MREPPHQTRAAAIASAALLALLVLGSDQVSKALVNSAISRGTTVDLIPGLRLTNVRNTGVAFGFFPGGGDVVSALSLGAVVLLVVYFVRHTERPGLWIPVGLLVGGALGNLLDRIRIGSVVDFIDPVAWPAFNLADSCIVFGVLGLLWVLEGPPARRWREQQQEAAARERPGADGGADAAA